MDVLSGIAKRKEQEQKKLLEDWQNVENGGFSVSRDTINQRGDFNLGKSLGEDIFVNNPEMQGVIARAKEQAKGYSGAEQGAMRQTARGEIAGQRSNYLKSLSSNLGRGGVGGARAAAVKGAADQKYAEQGAETERKMLLDSANMQRSGEATLADYLKAQAQGVAGMGVSQQQLGSAERTQKAANAANSGGGGGSWICTEVHKAAKFTLSEMKNLHKLKRYALSQTADAIRYFNECDSLIQAMNAAGFDFSELKPKIQFIVKKFKECPSCALKQYENMTWELIDTYKPELRNATI